jgi:inosine/xanthosine triphosphatase
VTRRKSLRVHMSPLSMSVFSLFFHRVSASPCLRVTVSPKNMPTIIVASTNPVKISAAQRGFEQMFPGETFAFQGISAPSGVSDQPMTSQETLQGAYNRAEHIRREHPEADYWVGIEGGVDESAPGEPGPVSLIAFAWVVVLDRERVGKGRTGHFSLPPRVTELIHQGMELGHADDLVFGRTNSKQENGAVGLLTGDVIDRAGFYEQAVIFALIPFRNAELYG